MRLPLHLRRRHVPEPATALLVAPADAAGLLAVCARLGGANLPAVHRVAGGFLLPDVPAAPAGLPGCLRLRRVAGSLFIPTDADVLPPPHADEVDGLSRGQGLILLPEGSALAFDPAAPVGLRDLLTAPVVRGDDWRPLPDPPPIADRIRLLELHRPEDTVEGVLEAGAAGVGRNAPRPAPAAGAGAAVAGRARLTLGGILAALGRFFNWRSLQQAGADLIDRAVRSSPRLSEELLGQQEAALRELLRQFREGKTEDALRRALPVGGERSGAVRETRDHPDARLPWHDLLYSLGNLLGAERRGPASVWHAADDVQRELAREYQRAAEEAIRRGDHRRAAYIYGRLLFDYRSAAAALAAGGLHRDAAVLFRDRLNDPVRAAAAFEAAGDFDAALPLYRDHGEHEKAGDLLLRLGDDEAAIAEYHRAARQLVVRRGDHLAAGELLWRKTGSAEQAAIYFSEGWSRRLGLGLAAANAVACAVRLLNLHAHAETPAALFTLIDEAEEFLRPPAWQGQAAVFFDAVAAVAELPHLSALRDDLRDRAFLGLALKLRQHADRERRAGTVVSDLFGRSGRWPATRVRDAEHALSLRQKQPRRGEPNAPMMAEVVLTRMAVTVAVQATGTGDVFVGDAGGAVTVFRVADGRIVRAAVEPWAPVSALAVGSDGRAVVLGQRDEGQVRLRSYLADSQGRFREHGEAFCPAEEVVCLSPEFNPPANLLLAGDADGGLVLLLCGDLLPVGRHAPQEGIGNLSAVRMLGGPSLLLVRVHGAGLSWGMAMSDEVFASARLPWTPDASLSWLRPDPGSLELVGLSDGRLAWSTLSLDGTRVETASADWDDGYRACALLGSGTVAAVTADGRVHFLRRQGRELRRTAETRLPPLSAVACFARPDGREVFVVTGDGRLVRVPVPV